MLWRISHIQDQETPLADQNGRFHRRPYFLLLYAKKYLVVLGASGLEDSSSFKVPGVIVCHLSFDWEVSVDDKLLFEPRRATESNMILSNFSSSLLSLKDVSSSLTGVTG